MKSLRSVPTLLRLLVARAWVRLKATTPTEWVLLGVAAAVGLVAVLHLFFAGQIDALWFGYFWSSDKGNGPEALQQTVVYAAIGVWFVPKFRAWMARHMDDLKAHSAQLVESLHARFDTHEAARDAQHAEKMAAESKAAEERAELLMHLKHIIRHSKDIPNLPSAVLSTGVADSAVPTDIHDGDPA